MSIGLVSELAVISMPRRFGPLLETVEEFEERFPKILMNIQYKDWKFLFFPETKYASTNITDTRELSIFQAWRPRCFHIVTKVTDRTGDRPIELTFIFGANEFRHLVGRSEKDLLKFIRSCIIRIEVHEVSEFLIYNENRIFDPHDSLKRIGSDVF